MSVREEAAVAHLKGRCLHWVLNLKLVAETFDIGANGGDCTACSIAAPKSPDALTRSFALYGCRPLAFLAHLLSVAFFVHFFVFKGCLKEVCLWRGLRGEQLEGPRAGSITRILSP